MAAPDFLASVARAHPGAPALDDGRRRWSYGELDRQVETTAGRLLACGVAGCPAAVVSESTGEAVIAVHAVLRAGGVLALLSPRLTAAELRPALELLRPKVVLAASEAWDRVAEAGVAPMPLETAATRGTETVWAGTSAASAPELPAGTEVVVWTSGTAGRPRGIALTRTNLDASIRATRVRLSLGPADRWLASLGIAHVGGLMLVLRAAATGALLVTRGRFRTEECAALVDGGVVTHASLVPAMLERVLEARADRSAAALRCLLVGGAACPRALVERALAAGLPLALTYGLSEATSQAATAPPELVARKPGTVGAPLEGLELRVDEAGEVLLRGPTVAAGYVGSQLPLRDRESWLHTGDLGELDNEGHLWITGGRAVRIVTGGCERRPGGGGGGVARAPGCVGRRRGRCARRALGGGGRGRRSGRAGKRSRPGRAGGPRALPPRRRQGAPPLAVSRRPSPQRQREGGPRRGEAGARGRWSGRSGAHLTPSRFGIGLMPFRARRPSGVAG